MMIDHETRMSIVRQHQDALKQSMLAARRTRGSRERDVPDRPKSARIYTFPKARAQAERGAAA